MECACSSASPFLSSSSPSWWGASLAQNSAANFCSSSSLIFPWPYRYDGTLLRLKSQIPSRSLQTKSPLCGLAVLPLGSRHAVVCSAAAAALQSENVTSSRSDKNPLNKATSNTEENLSAKERRKLRNERREGAKNSRDQPWKEAVEDRLDQKKKKNRGWQDEADINRCAAKGVRWWMMFATRKHEFAVAEQISIIFSEQFPEREFEVLVPTVPVKSKLKDGSASLSRKKLHEGIVLLRCILDRDVHFAVKKIPRVYDFFGNMAGYSLQPIVMPAPVANFNMESMYKRIKKEEEEFEIFKEQCRREMIENHENTQRFSEEQQLAAEGQQQRTSLQLDRFRSKNLPLEVGATIRVLSGPFVDFTGKVIELIPDVAKVKALVTVFGNDTQIVLDVKDVVIEAVGP